VEHLPNVPQARQNERADLIYGDPY